MKTYTYLGGRPLQHPYTIDIEEENGSQVVYFNSLFHVERRTRLPTQYSLEFTHAQILEDDTLIQQINKRYGKVTQPDSEGPF